MNRRLQRTPTFTRSLKRLGKTQPAAGPRVRETFSRLEDDPFDPSLRTHKLSGQLAGCWACSVASDLRMIFEFCKQDDEEIILLHDIGKHDQVY